MGLEELIDQLRGLPPEDLDEVVDFVAHLRRRAATAEEDPASAGESETFLDTIAADPILKGRFNAMLERGLAASARGEGRPADEVFADLRARSRKARGLE